MAFGTIAQAIDVLVRHRPDGISQRDLSFLIDPKGANIRADCDYLVREGHIRLHDNGGIHTYFPPK
jgi:hypothetical protein